MKSFCLLLFALFLLPSFVLAEGFTIKKDEHGLTVKLNGEFFTNYVIDQANKPYFFPIIGPGGHRMTRAYPMEDLEGERKDHPHHRSFYFGHQGISGFDTWHEKLTLEERHRKKGPEALEKALAGLGATVHREFSKIEADSDKAIITVANDYVNPKGEKLLADERTYTLRAPDGNTRIIDVDIVFTALYGPATLMDMKDAGFSVRVPTSLDVDSKKGGTIVNSEGDVDKAAWGKRAKWCDYSGPSSLEGGETVGVAILNHPSSLRFPTPWHVRSYGLFTANPFGMKSVAKGEDGTIEMKKGDTVTLKHRVIFHKGDHEAANIEAAWAAYAKEK